MINTLIEKIRVWRGRRHAWKSWKRNVAPDACVESNGFLSVMEKYNWKLQFQNTINGIDVERFK